MTKYASNKDEGLAVREYGEEVSLVRISSRFLRCHIILFFAMTWLIFPPKSNVSSILSDPNVATSYNELHFSDFLAFVTVVAAIFIGLIVSSDTNLKLYRRRVEGLVSADHPGESLEAVTSKVNVSQWTLGQIEQHTQGKNRDEFYNIIMNWANGLAQVVGAYYMWQRSSDESGVGAWRLEDSVHYVFTLALLWVIFALGDFSASRWLDRSDLGRAQTIATTYKKLRWAGIIGNREQPLSKVGHEVAKIEVSGAYWRARRYRAERRRVIRSMLLMWLIMSAVAGIVSVCVNHDRPLFDKKRVLYLVPIGLILSLLCIGLTGLLLLMVYRLTLSVRLKHTVTFVVVFPVLYYALLVRALAVDGDKSAYRAAVFIAAIVLVYSAILLRISLAKVFLVDRALRVELVCSRGGRRVWLTLLTWWLSSGLEENSSGAANGIVPVFDSRRLDLIMWVVWLVLMQLDIFKVDVGDFKPSASAS